MGDLTPTCAVFFARQRPLQAPAVNRDPELFLNGLDTGDGRQIGLGSSQGPHILDDLGRELVPFFGPTVLGKQTAQASLLECRLRQIDGWARNAEFRSHFDNRDSFHAVPSYHLLADLKEILGIEEWILFEQSVRDRVGARLEGASPFQLQRFLVGLFQLGHPAART
jgi:hypothetical protein